MTVRPILTSEPSWRPVLLMRCPSTSMPLVEPEVLDADADLAARLVDDELHVAAADAGVVDAQVGLRATAGDEAGRLQGVTRAVDLEEGAGAADLGDGRVADHRGVRLAAHPEAADGQVVGTVEGDRHRSGEHVALLLGMVLELLGELLEQGRVVRRESLEVGLGELDVEVVGHHPPLAGQDLGVVVALALESGRDLDRLDGAAERAGEGSGDQCLEPLLELREHTHARTSSPFSQRTGRSVLLRRPRGRRSPPRWDGARVWSGCRRCYRGRRCEARHGGVSGLCPAILGFGRVRALG